MFLLSVIGVLQLDVQTVNLDKAYFKKSAMYSLYIVYLFIVLYWELKLEPIPSSFFLFCFFVHSFVYLFVLRQRLPKLTQACLELGILLLLPPSVLGLHAPLTVVCI